MERDDNHFPVEIVFALPETQVQKRIEVPVGCTAGQAITISGILEQFPQIDLHKNRIGVFGQLIRPENIVQHNDRIEIYRPLIIDPKDVRRIRAKRSR